MPWLLPAHRNTHVTYELSELSWIIPIMSYNHPHEIMMFFAHCNRMRASEPGRLAVVRMDGMFKKLFQACVDIHGHTKAILLISARSDCFDHQSVAVHSMSCAHVWSNTAMELQSRPICPAKFGCRFNSSCDDWEKAMQELRLWSA